MYHLGWKYSTNFYLLYLYLHIKRLKYELLLNFSNLAINFMGSIRKTQIPIFLFGRNFFLVITILFSNFVNSFHWLYFARYICLVPDLAHFNAI
jgi:hypothetical protein